MFCRNCGNKIEDGNVFCTQCGAAVMGADAEPQKPQAQYTPPQDDFVLNNPTEEKPAKKKSGKKWIAPVAILAVVAAAVVAVVLNWGPISELFGGGLQASGNGNTDSAKLTGAEHLAKVETDSLGGYADVLSQAYGQLLKSNSSLSGAEMDLTLRVGDDILELLEEQLAYETGEDVDLSWLTEVALDMDVNYQDSLGQVEMGLLLAGENLLGLDVIYDMDSQMYWLAIPDLSSDYLEVGMEELGMSASDYETAVEQMTAVQEMLPSENVVNKLLKKYVAIALDCIEEADKETETLELDGLKQEATALTVKVTQKDLVNMAIAILEEARNDQDLKTVVDNYGDYMNEMDASYADLYGYTHVTVDYYAVFTEGVEDAIEELKDTLEDCEDGNYIKLTTYVDSADQVIGRTIKVASDGEVQETVSYLTVTEGNTFSFKASVAEMEITGDGTIKSDILDAEYSICFDDTEYLVLEFISFDQAKLAQGYLSGTVRIEPTAKLMDEMFGDSGMAMLADLALEVTLETSDTTATIDLDVLANDTLLVGLTLDTKTSNGGDIKKPSSRDTVDAMDEDEVMEWVQNMDFDTLLQNLEDAGVPSEYVDAIETMIDSMLDSMNGVEGDAVIDEPQDDILYGTIA